MSLGKLPSPEDSKQNAAPSSKAEAKPDLQDDAAQTTLRANMMSDADIRAILLSIPARFAALEARVAKAENISQLVASPAMSQPLPPASTKQQEAKATPFSQLRAALASNGEVLGAVAGKSALQKVHSQPSGRVPAQHQPATSATAVPSFVHE